MNVIELILIGISLSIDSMMLAFSISLISDYKINKKTYSLTVGLFHFFMPILGYLMKFFINRIIYIPSSIVLIVVIILIIIGILIDDKNNMLIVNPFTFSLSVSIDSLAIGLTLSLNNLLTGIIIFSIISAFLTYLSFSMKNKLSRFIGDRGKIIAIIILLIILVYNIASM